MIFNTRLAVENWTSKYQYNGETQLGTWVRAAKAIAQVETKYGATESQVEYWADQFLKALVNFEAAPKVSVGEDIYVDLEGNTLRAIGLKATPGGRITANAGTEYEKATILNCFAGHETFLTSEGSVTFESQVGKEVTVLTKEGWLPATVESFGEQMTQEVVFAPAMPFTTHFDLKTNRLTKAGTIGAKVTNGYRKVSRTNYQKVVEVTPDHRWILVGNLETTKLKIGDVVESHATQFNDEDFESETYKQGFVHGLIYGDGSHTHTHSTSGEHTYSVRLCGDKVQFQDRFSHETYPPSMEGEPLCSVKTYCDLKRVPEGCNPIYLRGFVDGWAATDGFEHASESLEIGSQDDEAIQWLITNAALAGYVVNGYRQDKNMVTNYGTRSAPFQRVMITSTEQTKWKVMSIVEKEVKPVYCAVVPGVASFTLENGIYTGNCFINSPVTKAQIKYTKNVPNTDQLMDCLIETEATPDNLTNIFLTLLEAAETLKSEGGYGMNFGFIRPRSSLIDGVGIRHPGVVTYMELWDKMSGVIVQGDNDGYEDRLTDYLAEDTKTNLEKVMPRKGAMMAVLPIWHPDIEEFIRAKQVKGRLTKFNISVLIDDRFMEAVENDDFYTLHFNGKDYKKIKAAELYDLIMQSTYNRAEPGILFLDNMNRQNPLIYLGPVSATNPCVTGDTWIATTEGPRQVNELIGKRFDAIVEGKSYPTKSEGFWETGYKEVFELKTHRGYTVRLTEDHPLRKVSETLSYDNEWTEVKDLHKGDTIRIADHRASQSLEWGGEGDFKFGFVLGYEAAKDFETELLENIHEKSSQCQLGFITGLMDRQIQENYADLNATDFDLDAEGNRVIPEIELSLQYQDALTLTNIQRMLIRFGILSTIKGDRLTLSGRDFINQVHLKNGNNNTEEYLDTVESIVYVGKETVYDVTIAEVHEFDANGIRVSNCGEVPGTSYMDKHYIPAEYLKPYMGNTDEHLIGFTTVCLLGSINLTQFIGLDRKFDFERYRHTVEVLARILENVNDIGNVPLPAYKWALENVRQYGMGINGLGSAMFMLGIRYGAEEGNAFVKEIHRIKDDETMRVSALLARDRGPFPMYSEEYLNTPYFTEYTLASEESKDLVRQYGLRNGKRLTNPPLGNSSVICDMISNGIEPVFSYGYNRTIITDEWPQGLTQDNVKEILPEKVVGDATVWQGEFAGKTYYYEPHNRGLCVIEAVEDYGYAWVRDNFPEDLGSDYLVTAQDLKVREHVAVQALVQEGCDQSVSKTCSIPNDYPYEDFKDLYKEAWKANLIGFTTYREGTMEAVMAVAEDTKTEKTKANNATSLLELLKQTNCITEDVETTEEGVIVRNIRLIDEFANGKTVKISAEHNKYYMHFSYLPSDDRFPIALWIHSNEVKSGEYISLNRAIKAIMNLLTEKGVDTDLVQNQYEKSKDEFYHVRFSKMISMALRHNISVVDVVNALTDIEGDYIASTLSAVRRFLSEHVPEGTLQVGKTCDDCGSDQVVFEGGCDRCLACGSSGCL